VRPGTSSHWLDGQRPPVNPLWGIRPSPDAEIAAFEHGQAVAADITVQLNDWPPRSLYDVRVGIQWQVLAARLELHRHVLATRRALGLVCGEHADFSHMRCVARAGHFHPCDFRVVPRLAPVPETAEERIERVTAQIEHMTARVDQLTGIIEGLP